MDSWVDNSMPSVPQRDDADQILALILFNLQYVLSEHGCLNVISSTLRFYQLQYYTRCY